MADSGSFVKPTRKIYFYTFGCKVNQYDTQSLKESIFRREKSAETFLYEETSDASQADVIIINTCTVTAEADRQCRQMARRFLRNSRQDGRNAKVIFYGCYVRRCRNINGSDDEFSVGEEHDRLLFASTPAELMSHLDIDAPDNLSSSTIIEEITRFGDGENERSRAYVKIQDGCDQFCTYCIVPYVRDKMVSRPAQSVIDEVKKLVGNGYPEIVLCGVRLGRYNPQDNYKLEDLVEDLLNIRDNFRIRFSSIEVLEISSRLLDLMKKYPSRICRHLHIPLQSGSDAILKKMNRPYTARQYEEKVLHLKKELEPLAVTTDIIIGFPGESDGDFRATCEIARRIGFSKLHIFPYSVRPGTAASKMDFQKDAVYLKEIARRKKAIFELDNFLQKKWREESMKRGHQAVYIGDGWVLTEDYQYYKLSEGIYTTPSLNGIFDFRIKIS